MIRILIILILLTGCSTKNKHYCTDDGCPDFYKEESELTAMDKFFECLGDSSKCKDIMNKEQKQNFEEQIK